MPPFDKDTRYLILGILLGAAMTALYDLFKAYFLDINPNLPESFVITLAFLGSVGLMSGIFLYAGWNKERRKKQTKESQK